MLILPWLWADFHNHMIKEIGTSIAFQIGTLDVFQGSLFSIFLWVCVTCECTRSPITFIIYMSRLFSKKAINIFPYVPSCLTCKISHTNFVLISCFPPLKWFAHVNKLKFYLNSAQTLLIWNLLVKKKNYNNN